MWCQIFNDLKVVLTLLALLVQWRIVSIRWRMAGRNSDTKIRNAMAKKRLIIPLERIEGKILIIRGHKVMLSSDLATLYGVETRSLVQAVKRNRERFPEDFMFQLTTAEF